MMWRSKSSHFPKNGCLTVVVMPIALQTIKKPSKMNPSHAYFINSDFFSFPILPSWSSSSSQEKENKVHTQSNNNNNIWNGGVKCDLNWNNTLTILQGLQISNQFAKYLGASEIENIHARSIVGNLLLHYVFIQCNVTTTY